MPQNHAQALRERTPLSRRARWLWALVGVLVVAAVLVLVLSQDSPAKRGCFKTFLPGAMGAEPYNACGAAARSTCGSLRGSSQFSAVEVLALERACRKGGIPVG